jgi:hypothetical protein
MLPKAISNMDLSQIHAKLNTFELVKMGAYGGRKFRAVGNDGETHQFAMKEMLKFVEQLAKQNLSPKQKKMLGEVVVKLESLNDNYTVTAKEHGICRYLLTKIRQLSNIGFSKAKAIMGLYKKAKVDPEVENDPSTPVQLSQSSPTLSLGQRPSSAPSRAIGLISSKGSAERCKARPKQSGLNEEGMADAMSDEKDRSGKAGADQTLDEIKPIAPSSKPKSTPKREDAFADLPLEVSKLVFSRMPTKELMRLFLTHKEPSPWKDAAIGELLERVDRDEQKTKGTSFGYFADIFFKKDSSVEKIRKAAKQYEVLKKVLQGGTELNLAGQPVTDDDLALIAERSPGLKVLDLSYCKDITVEGLKKLPKSLVVLRLNSCPQISEPAFLKEFTALESLEVYNSAFTVRFLKTVPPSLITLGYSPDEVTIIFPCDFAKALPQQLENLTVGLSLRLTDFDVGYLPRGLLSLEAFGEMLSKASIEFLPPGLQHLHLFGRSPFTDATASKLPQSLKSLTIHFPGREFTNGFFKNLSCHSLESFLLMGGGATRGGIKDLPSTLRSLEATCLEIAAEPEELSLPAGLQKLVLDDPALTDEEIDQFPITLKSLTLKSFYPKLTNRALEKLHRFPSLSHFGISHYIKITPEGFKNLPETITSITYLGPLQDTDLRHFPEWIETLDLSYCSELTDECTKYLPKNLKRLKITHCYKITKEMRDLLRRERNIEVE